MIEIPFNTESMAAEVRLIHTDMIDQLGVLSVRGLPHDAESLTAAFVAICKSLQRRNLPATPEHFRQYMRLLGLYKS